MNFNENRGTIVSNRQCLLDLIKLCFLKTSSICNQFIVTIIDVDDLSRELMETALIGNTHSILKGKNK